MSTCGGYATFILAQLSAPLGRTPPIHAHMLQYIIYPNNVLTILVVNPQLSENSLPLLRLQVLYIAYYVSFFDLIYLLLLC
jgi:hypothetical protein